MGFVLYWNLQKKPLIPEVVQLCDELQVDILVLSECTIDSTSLLAGLNGGSLRGYSYFYDPSPKPKFHWYTRLPQNRLQRVLDGGGLSIVQVEFLTGLTVLIGAVHLISKINATADEQYHFATITSEAVREMERSRGSDFTVLVGDFNMNPFDKGMASVNGFNAVMDREIARRKTVSYAKREYPFFYNPMWRHFGHALPGVSGTHYYSRGLVRYYWNIYDQVLIRPSLLSRISDESVRIVDSLAGTTLAGSGRIWKCESDHLPIVFKVI